MVKRLEPLVLLAYLGGACLFTWPLVIKLNDFYMGAGGELGGWLWRFWWYAESIRALVGAHAPFPYLVQYLLSAGCYPEAGNVVDLYLFSWPLTALFGNPAAYNLKGLLVLTLNGLGGYVLARGLGATRTSALACGAFFAFNTYTSWTLAEGRIRQGILCFLPLYVYFLIKALKEGGRGNWIGAGIFLALHSLIYWFYGLFALLLTGVLVADRVLRRGEPLPKGFARGLLLAGVTALLLALPFLTPYIRQVARHEPLAEVQWFTAFPEPGAPMTNPQRVAFMNSRSVDWLVNPSHRHSFPLVLVLLAAIPLVVRCRRRQALPWLAALLFFYVMSLGPWLTAGAGEQLVRTGAGRPVMLPFAFFYHYVPLFSRIFNPFHFVSVVALCLSILAAFGLSAVEERLQLRGWWACALFPLVAAAYLVPMARLGQAPIPVVRMSTPPFYRQLASEPFCGIVELPMSASADLIHYYQITHRKKILRGWADGALPDGFPRCDLLNLQTFEDHRDNAFARWLGEGGAGDSPAPAALSKDRDRLKARGYRYLLVHEYGCMMQEPSRGPQLFDALCRAVEPFMGKGEVVPETVCEFRPDPESRRLPTQGRQTTFRLAVFRF